MNARKKRRLRRLISEQQNAQYVDLGGVFVPVCECYWCRFMLPVECMTIDHFVPKSLKGTNHGENIVLACAECNTRKASHIPCPQCGSVRGKTDRLPVEYTGVLQTNRRLRTCGCGYQWVYVNELNRAFGSRRFYIEDAPWSQSPTSKALIVS